MSTCTSFILLARSGQHAVTSHFAMSSRSCNECAQHSKAAACLYLDLMAGVCNIYGPISSLWRCKYALGMPDAQYTAVNACAPICIKVAIDESLNDYICDMIMNDIASNALHCSAGDQLAIPIYTG